MFIDSGALYALADRRDPAHDRARRFHETSGVGYVMTDFVLAETMSLLTKRVGKAVAVRFGEGLLASSRVRIDEPTAHVRRDAWELFTARSDKEWDLIDCTSFALMTDLGLVEAFAFDRHFQQCGFRLLPGQGD